MNHRVLRAVQRSAWLIAGLSLSACGGGGAGGGGGSEPAALQVVSMTPAANSQGVSLDAILRVTFSRPLAPASVTSSALRVGAAKIGETPGLVTLVPDGTGKVLQFEPTSSYPGGKTLSLLVSTSLRSTTGDALGGITTFLFATRGSSDGVVLPLPSALRATAQPLNIGRRNHTATLLADGKVLITGGYIAGTTVTDRAEIFNPATETFTAVTARMRQPRAGHTATRLADGRVLLAGGWYEVASGSLNTALTAEIFNPATSTFTDTGNLTIQRADHAALRLPDGRVLITGGSRLEGAFLADHATAEAWDPFDGAWDAWAHPMAHSHAAHAMVDVQDGRWLIAGGSDLDLRPEILDLSTGVFSAFNEAVQDHGRFGCAAARFSSGNVSVVGGEAVGDVLFFDRLTTRLMNSGSGTNRPRAYGTATRIGPDRVLVAGGIDYANGSFILATCDLVVEGGIGGSTTYSTSVRFPTGIANHTATTLLDGRVLFVGGLTPNYGQPELTGAYLFTP